MTEFELKLSFPDQIADQAGGSGKSGTVIELTAKRFDGCP